MSDLMNDRYAHIYQWLQGQGADERAVEFRPHEYLRKSGFLATTESVERVNADLVAMQEDGWVSIGPDTSAGNLVMATGKLTEALLLPFERLVAMHALMSDEERLMLSQWEKVNLGRGDQVATSDWPGWRIVIKRLAH